MGRINLFPNRKRGDRRFVQLRKRAESRPSIVKQPRRPSLKAVELNPVVASDEPVAMATNHDVPPTLHSSSVLPTVLALLLAAFVSRGIRAEFFSLCNLAFSCKLDNSLLTPAPRPRPP